MSDIKEWNKERWIKKIKDAENLATIPNYSSSEEIMVCMALGRMDELDDDQSIKDPLSAWLEILDDTQREAVNDWRESVRPRAIK